MNKFAKYKTDSPNESYYGLPHEIKFCKECTISNQRPNSIIEQKHTKESKKPVIAFNENGVCDACQTKDWKEKINWDDRENELNELLNKHRSSDGSYDCLVPGSGGKDSFMQAHLLKYKFKIQISC